MVTAARQPQLMRLPSPRRVVFLGQHRCTREEGAEGAARGEGEEKGREGNTGTGEEGVKRKERGGRREGEGVERTKGKGREIGWDVG